MSPASPVIVLGMHRSGTSCLIGSLQQAGLELGDVNTQAPYNRRGNRENMRIMALNEQVLVESGGAWDRPPCAIVWSAKSISMRDSLLAEYRDLCTWGFKDPRTLLTLDGWLDALPHARLIGTVRHPLAVAGSLSRRDKMSTEGALELWLAYNERLLGLHERSPFPIVSFDGSEAEYFEALKRACELLALPAPERVTTFFDPSLRSENVCGEPLPARVAAVYQALLRSAV